MRAHFRAAAAFSALTLCGCSDSTTPLSSVESSGGTAGSGASTSSTAGTAGTAGSSGANTTGGAGASGSAGAASGAGGNTAGSSGAGAGGTGGTAGAAGGGAGGTSADGWVPIFNGVDLTDWYPKITGLPYKEDPYNTFKVENGAIRVSYEDYPDGTFDGRYGLLYYDKPLTNYRVRVEYRFFDPQAGNPPGWGHNNSGLMVFGLDPSEITGNDPFPPILELQLLGDPSGGGDTSPNLCKLGGYTVTLVNGNPPGDGCDKSIIPPPPPPPEEWITVEAEVHVNGDTKVFQYPDTTTPALTFSGPKTGDGQPLTSGYISLQSESQPCEFRKVELMELPE